MIPPPSFLKVSGKNMMHHPTSTATCQAWQVHKPFVVPPFLCIGNGVVFWLYAAAWLDFHFLSLGSPISISPKASIFWSVSRLNIAIFVSEYRLSLMFFANLCRAVALSISSCPCITAFAALASIVLNCPVVSSCPIFFSPVIYGPFQSSVENSNHCNLAKTLNYWRHFDLTVSA